MSCHSVTATLHPLSVFSLSLHVRGGMYVRGQRLLTNILYVKGSGFSLFTRSVFQLVLSHLKCAQKTEAI